MALDTPFARRLAGYTAAAGASLLAASGADAQIVYQDIDPDAVVSNGETISLDLDEDGTDDFAFRALAPNGNILGRLLFQDADGDSAPVNAVLAYDPIYFGNSPSVGVVSLLDSGAEVGPAGLFYSVGIAASQYYYNGGPQFYYPFVGVEGLMGFRFTAGAGTTHYGWARIAGNAQVDGGTLFEIAFQSTPDTPIAAGDRGAVATEPGALADGYAFSPIAPNPVTAAARFTVEVGEEQAVRVSVVDMLGREVAVLHDGVLAAGAPERLDLDASALPGGVYTVLVRGESFSTVRRVTVAR